MKLLRYFQIATITLALALGNNATAFCQSPQNSTSPVQNVKDQVQKIGVAKKVTVILLTGKEYYGAISKIEPDRFEIDEVDLNRWMEFDPQLLKTRRSLSSDWKYSTMPKRENFDSTHSNCAKDNANTCQANCLRHCVSFQRTIRF